MSQRGASASMHTGKLEHMVRAFSESWQLSRVSCLFIFLFFGTTGILLHPQWGCDQDWEAGVEPTYTSKGYIPGHAPLALSRPVLSPTSSIRGEKPMSWYAWGEGRVPYIKGMKARCQ